MSEGEPSRGLARVAHDPRLQAGVLGAVLAVPHLVFLALDSRPPNDHDVWYTAGVAEAWTNAQLLPGPFGPLRALAEHFLFEGWHPQLAQTVLLAAMLVFGPSLLVFRGTNLLFFALLIGSAYSIGRQLRGHRFGLLAMTLVAWTPGMLAYARKWDPMFHGSAVSALAWALALRCLAPDAPRLRWPWIALGATLGARFYTHPTGLPDLGLTAALTALFAVGLARRRREALRPVLVRTGWMAGAALILGAWFLGLVPVVPDEPSYQLTYYLRWRASYVLGGDAGVLSLDRHLQGAQKAARAVWRWHWQPALVLALIAPGLVLAVRRVHREALSGRGLLCVLLLCQIPLAHLTFSNGAITPDWMHLTPLTVIVAADGLLGLAAGRPWQARTSRALLVTSLGFVAFAAFGPMLASATGPDPLLDARAYTSPLLEPFEGIDTGGRTEAPHLISSTPEAGDVLARTLATRVPPEELDRAALLQVVDLTLTMAPAVVAPLCRDDTSVPCCGFTPGRRGGPRDRLKPLWPFRFAGWADVDITLRDAADARFVLVRLWHDGQYGPLDEGQAHEPTDSTWMTQCLDAAGTWVTERWPDAELTPMPDPTGRLISRMWGYSTEYAHRSFLIDRGEGVSSVPPQMRSPIGGRPPDAGD